MLEKGKIVATTVAIAVMIVVIAIASYHIMKNHEWDPHEQHEEHQQPMKTTARAVIVPAVQLTSPSMTQSSEFAAILKLATARKRDGVEHALIRQLVANPHIADGEKYKFEGRPDDARAIRQWAGRAAHILAIKAGYFDAKFHAEIRVKVPNQVAYVVQEDDSHLVVAEYRMTPDLGFAGLTPQSPHNTQLIVDNAPPTHFLGWPGAGHVVPTYEYVYTG